MYVFFFMCLANCSLTADKCPKNERYITPLFDDSSTAQCHFGPDKTWIKSKPNVLTDISLYHAIHILLTAQNSFMNTFIRISHERWVSKNWSKCWVHILNASRASASYLQRHSVIFNESQVECMQIECSIVADNKSVAIRTGSLQLSTLHNRPPPRQLVCWSAISI